MKVNIYRRWCNSNNNNDNEVKKCVVKMNKERIRRDKINRSMIELREIIRESVQLTDHEILKLEKADILELAIQQIKLPIDSQELSFKNGIKFCANETQKFLQNYDEYQKPKYIGEVLQQRLKLCEIRSDSERKGVLLDLSQRNREHCNSRKQLAVRHYTVVDQKESGKKREVLEKIRRKIFEKRKNGCMVMGHNHCKDCCMWRPWNVM